MTLNDRIDTLNMAMTPMHYGDEWDGLRLMAYITI